MVGQFNLVFLCWRGGLVRAKRDGMFCPMPLLVLGDASLPTTRPGRGVASLAGAVHLSRGKDLLKQHKVEMYLCSDGVLMKWFLPRLSCRIHGCCVKKAVEGVGAVKICGI